MNREASLTDQTKGGLVAEDVGVKWDQLLSEERISSSSQKGALTLNDHRTAFERDFDRVVFSTPVRRLKDKTQVFPLDMHDGVRTRLTHSLEVANLARSMGVAVVGRLKGLSSRPNAIRDVPALLSTIALTHDLGNPPFGHQGEEAIRTWVRNEESTIKGGASDFNADLFKDFLWFEGNAQGFRILTRLQHVNHSYGLNLAAGTLRSFMKYPWYASNMASYHKKKKFGCFASEREIFEWAGSKTGLSIGERHPLSYLMEICDDIAYSVLDAEDGVKKELITTEEVISYLMSITGAAGDQRVLDLCANHQETKGWLGGLGLQSKEVRDAQIEMLRSTAIGLMVSDAIDCFVSQVADGSWQASGDIAENFACAKVVKGLKDFAVDRVYKHHTVIRAELPGHTAIPQIMDVMWQAIVNVGDKKANKSDEYVYSRISKNYVRVYERSLAESSLPIWYRRLQLLCDQICGMTDSYALRLHGDLKELSII